MKPEKMYMCIDCRKSVEYSKAYFFEDRNLGLMLATCESCYEKRIAEPVDDLGVVIKRS